MWSGGIMQNKPALLFPIFQTFPSHWISEVTEDVDIHFLVYSTSLWNIFIVNETLSIKESLQRNLAFALVQVDYSDFHSYNMFRP
jgi:hypothetical protein